MNHKSAECQTAGKKRVMAAHESASRVPGPHKYAMITGEKNAEEREGGGGWELPGTGDRRLGLEREGSEASFYLWTCF